MTQRGGINSFRNKNSTGKTDFQAFIAPYYTEAKYISQGVTGAVFSLKLPPGTVDASVITFSGSDVESVIVKLNKTKKDPLKIHSQIDEYREIMDSILLMLCADKETVKKTGEKWYAEVDKVSQEWPFLTKNPLSFQSDVSAIVQEHAVSEDLKPEFHSLQALESEFMVDFKFHSDFLQEVEIQRTIYEFGLEMALVQICPSILFAEIVEISDLQSVVKLIPALDPKLKADPLLQLQPVIVMEQFDQTVHALEVNLVGQTNKLNLEIKGSLQEHVLHYNRMMRKKEGKETQEDQTLNEQHEQKELTLRAQKKKLILEFEILEKTARFLLWLMAVGGYAHGDPHKGNIMKKNDRSEAILIDFGSAVRISDVQQANATHLWNRYVTKTKKGDYFICGEISPDHQLFLKDIVGMGYPTTHTLHHFETYPEIYQQKLKIAQLQPNYNYVDFHKSDYDWLMIEPFEVEPIFCGYSATKGGRRVRQTRRRSNCRKTLSARRPRPVQSL